MHPYSKQLGALVEGRRAALAAATARMERDLPQLFAPPITPAAAHEAMALYLASAAYAPSQAALTIGAGDEDNLYLAADLSGALPGTPLSLSAM